MDAPAQPMHTATDPVALIPVVIGAPAAPVVPVVVITFDQVIGNALATKAKAKADADAIAARKARFDADNSALATAYNGDSTALGLVQVQDQADAAKADAALAGAVKSAGGVAVVNPDGTVTAYEPDGAGSYTVKTLQLSTQTVPPATSPAS